MYSLFILKRATDETTEIYNYYEFISEGLGERFLNILDNYISQLQETPFIFKRFLKKRDKL